MVITAPPSDVGGEKETLVAPFEAVAITAIGDPGTFGGGDTTLPPDPGATVTLALDFAESDPDDIKDNLGKLVDLIIHGGTIGQQPTTVIDLTESAPEVVREGAGDPTPFL